MSFSEKLKALREERAACVKKMDALVETAEKADREMSADESELFDTLESEIKSIDSRTDRINRMIEAVAEKASPVDADDIRGPLIQTEKAGNKPRKREKGTFFAKYASLLAKSGNIGEVAANLADRGGDKEMGALIRAAVNPADSATPAWAGELLQEETQGFIEMLRPMTVYGRIPGATNMQFTSGNIRVPRQTSGVSGGFLSEGQSIPVKAGSFDSVSLSPKKLGVITVATTEILLRSDPSLETIIRDSMLRDTAIVMDRQFLSAVGGGGVAPAGIFENAVSDNGAAPIVGSATGVAVDDAMADIQALHNAVMSANVPMSNPVWIMHPTTKLKLMNMRSATGAFYWRDQLVSGTLDGIPVITSTLFDLSLNGGGASAIDDLALIDGGALIKATGMMPSISISSEASVHMDDAPSADIGGATTPVRSFFQTQSTGIRLTYEVDWRSMYAGGIAVQHVGDIKW